MVHESELTLAVFLATRKPGVVRGEVHVDSVQATFIRDYNRETEQHLRFIRGQQVAETNKQKRETA